MSWKAIGHSVIGAAHLIAAKACEDAIKYAVIPNANDEILICCASDGAGSAAYAAWASDFTTYRALDILSEAATCDATVTEGTIYALAEDIYAGLNDEAMATETPLNEYSCTLLGCYITKERAIFFQIGDGAIIRNDGTGFYTVAWWPQNGEYQNTTSFVVDDPAFGNLNVMVLDEQINEVSIFSDGLQMLALNTERQDVHQPFFNDLFKVLRTANDPDKVGVLNRKLAEYLNSRQINERTDDDKTLFLASRLLG